MVLNKTLWQEILNYQDKNIEIDAHLSEIHSIKIAAFSSYRLEKVKLFYGQKINQLGLNFI